jgi:predicted  nucleic acid-binding Zn-ribbon protein
MLRHRDMGVVQNPSQNTPRPEPSKDGIDIRMAHRVAELERALAVAREEQDALQKDLVEVRERRQADQDTIQRLEHQLGPTHQSGSEAPSRAPSGH